MYIFLNSTNCTAMVHKSGLYLALLECWIDSLHWDAACDPQPAQQEASLPPPDALVLPPGTDNQKRL